MVKGSVEPVGLKQRVCITALNGLSVREETFGSLSGLAASPNTVGAVKVKKTDIYVIVLCRYTPSGG